jgi:CRISPR-associated endonuclease/helicase Cas3
MKAIAHHNGRNGKSQTLHAHLAEVASLCNDFAAKLGLPICGELIGLLHDLGKYSQAFQVYILSAVGILDQDTDEEAVDHRELKGKIDHSTTGAQGIWQVWGNAMPIE